MYLLKIGACEDVKKQGKTSERGRAGAKEEIV